MESAQDFLIGTEGGKTFRIRITELGKGKYRWDYFEDRGTANGYIQLRPQNPTSGEPFKKPQTAFADMIQFIISHLEKEKDKIKYLDNSSNCDLISAELQRNIIERQSYIFPIKVKGK